MDNKGEADSPSSSVPVAGKKVISPINDLSSKPDLDKLAAEQEAKDTANDPVQTPPATSVISPEGSVATPAEAASPDAAPKTPDTPPKPGEKIDPNSVALWDTHTGFLIASAKRRDFLSGCSSQSALGVN